VSEQEIAGLSTEATDPALAELDRLPTADVVRAVIDGHDEVLAAVRAVEDVVARLAEETAERMHRGGRVIYAGAGSGGRVALLDATEWGPTFSVPEGQVIALVAGDQFAPGSPEEAAAEDDAEAGAEAIRALQPTPHDVVIGVSASGRTPYVLGAIVAAGAPPAEPLAGGEAAALAAPPAEPLAGGDGADLAAAAPAADPHAPAGERRTGGAGRTLTAAITSQPNSRLAAAVDITIEVPVGPEPIAGSTRLKAGTAQKLVLNAFSTAVMVRRGRTLGNLMVGMRVANEKLRARAAVVCMSATGCSEAEARAALAATGDDLAAAVVSLGRGVDAGEARRRLDATGGAVRAALEGP
jgi:N-acetylmuramic acid 6-phosphate etherase